MPSRQETGELECRRGEWNSMCSGEMRRYMEEHRCTDVAKATDVMKETEKVNDEKGARPYHRRT